MELPRTRQIGRAYLLSIAIWGGLSFLTGWQYRIWSEPRSNSSFLDMMLVAGARGIAFALLTPPIFYVVRRYIARVSHPLWYLAAYVCGLIPFMVSWACIRWFVLPPWDMDLQRFVSRSARSPLEMIQSGFADLITMYLAIVVAAHAYQYFERVRQQELERCEYQQALAASELQALKMQLHPHFLFNTLNGISTLIDTDRECAKAMVIKLSSLLHTALRYSGSDLIPLREELSWVGEYLDIEKMRFGARLTVAWSIAPDTSEILVPQLILQPLVENAIHHGIASSRGNAWVEISSHRNKNVVELQVRNSIGSNRPEGTGLGLRNTKARLTHLYSGEATLSFVVSEDKTAIAAIRLPALSFTQRSIEERSDAGRLENANHAKAPGLQRIANPRDGDGASEESCVS